MILRGNNMAVSTSIVVNFSTGAAAETNKILKAELDEIKNEDKTSFIGGDAVFYGVYKENVLGFTQKNSAGQISFVSNVERTKVDTITFADTNTASLSFPVKSISSVEWLGTSLGSLTYIGNSQVKATNPGCAIAKVTYKSSATIYKLQAPGTINGNSDFSIIICINELVV